MHSPGMSFKYYKPAPLITFILILSVIYNFILKEVEHVLNNYAPFLAQITDYFHIFSTFSFLLFTLIFIEFIGWRYSFFKWLINIPNLNGRYEGKLISSYDNSTGNHLVKDCVIEIVQTASKFKIYSYFGDRNLELQTSSAISISEEILKQDNGVFIIFCVFVNEPDILLKQLNNHEGTVKFLYNVESKSLKGEYYNQRQHFGKIEVKFKRKKINSTF